MIDVPSRPSAIRSIPTASYPDWRPGQQEAVKQVLSTSARFVHVHGAPGSGKTLTNMAVAGLTSGRVLYLTNTRALVQQLGEFGFSVIKGRDNYTCGEGGDYPTCSRPKKSKRCKARTCPYREALTAAQESDIVVTNYAYNAYAGEALGDFDLVVCDEAHNVESWLGSWLEFELPLNDVRQCGITPPTEKETWIGALSTILPFMKERAAEAPEDDLVKERSRLNLLCRRIQHVYETKWICIEVNRHAAVFSPDDVAPYAGRKVWREAKKVILSSASLMPSILASLGLTKDVDRVDLPSTFDYTRRPILFVEDKPRLRISQATTDDTYDELRRRVHFICDVHARRGHKGIIHSHSYHLNRRLEEAHSVILTHRPGEPAPLDTFRRSPHPCALMSPTIGEGINLPYDDCRFIIFPKVPFVNSHDPTTSARNRRIPAYIDDLTAGGFIQAVDRGMRADDDACVVYVLDDHWTWWRRRVEWPTEVSGSFGTTTLDDIINRLNHQTT